MISQYLFLLVLICTQIISIECFQGTRVVTAIRFSSSSCHFKCSNAVTYDGSSMMMMNSMLLSQRSRRRILKSSSPSKLRASETSSADFMDVIVSKTRSIFHRGSRNTGDETIVATRNNYYQRLIRSLSSLSYLTDSSKTIASSKIIYLFRQSWWIMPILIAIIPIYCAIINGTCALMPDWWPVVNIDYVKRSKDAAFVIGYFLFSNIAYFVSGLYLLQKFPFKDHTTTTKKPKPTENTKLSMLQLLPAMNIMNMKPTQYSMLGIWVLASGFISTIFHSVQALGSFAVANALCYIDHAFAISAASYFLKTCGRPSRRTLTIGLISLVTLAVTYPGYAWLHSTWHYLSALTATEWAIEGYNNNNESAI